MRHEELPQWYGDYTHLTDDGKDTRRLTYEYDDGRVICTDLVVFEGIHLGLMDVDASELHAFTPLPSEVLEIVHCRRGRFECELARDACICIAEGDFAVISSGHIPDHNRYSFPLRSFLCLAIVVDFAMLSSETRGLLAAFSIDLDRLYQNLRLENRWFTGACADNPAVATAFEELYQVVLAHDQGGSRLRVLELLFLIERFHAGRERHRYHSDSRAHTVRLMRDELIASLDERVRLAELARRHNISLTLFQSTFKDIYGLSPCRYLKHYRMHQAADRLRAGTESVAEIALSLGYQNASKFASAFRAVLGLSPREYRKANTTPPVLEPSR
jgi:AraC-like DNA-binding protein